MRVCIFCQVPLSAANRAKEHVLRHSWLRALGHKKSGISLGKFSKHGFIAEQNLAADQLQTGEVCANCNNGWMDHLDRRIEHIILGLARTPGTGIHLSKQDSRTVGRWLLKTACSFMHTDAHERRHIPRSILSNVRREGYLPPGFVAFAARSALPTKGVGIAHLDMWPESSLGHIGGLPQTRRLKFGIQYDNVMLGCSYVNCVTPVFTGVDGFHVPLLQSRAKFVLTMPPPGEPDQWIEFPINVDNTILNLFLLLVGVTHSE
jgi:hypothetical protein